MKKVTLFRLGLLTALFFICFSAHSQTSDSNNDTPVKKELSESDFKRAKKMYLDMMQTASYKKSREVSRKFRARMNKVKLPNKDVLMQWHENPEMLRAWTLENYKNTSYKTPEELQKAYTEQKNLGMQYINENMELYMLMGRSSLEQFREILKPEEEMIRREAMSHQ